MTEALAIQNPAPMRIVDSPIGKVIPALDIAENIGYNRSSITKTISRNSGLLEGLSTVQSLPTPGGNQDFLCLNYDGIERLLLLIRPAKTKKELCDRQAVLRAKAFDRLSDARKPEIPAPAIDTELQNARHLAEQTGGDLAAFQAIALKKCGMEDYIPALKASPSLIHGEVGWFIPTQLGEMCALTAIQFNHWLNNKGYQYREGNVWRLQPLGEMHGQEYWFEAPSGHREIRIRWRESILYASGLKREIPASQLMLPAQAQRA